MTRLSWLAGIGALVIWGQVAAQGVNPFDPRRIAPGPLSSASGSVSQESASNVKTRSGFLCGIEQTLDRARVCVDGEWMSLSVFEARVGHKVKRIGALSIVFQDGKSQQLGEVMRSWKTRTPLGKKEVK